MNRRSASSRSNPCQQRGAVLLETLLALGLLLLATGTVVNGLTAGTRATGRLEHDAHATDLAITVLSWMEMGLLPASTQDARRFDHPFRDWTYEIEIESLPDAVALGADRSKPLARVRVTTRHDKHDRELSLSQLILLRHEARPQPRTRVDPKRLQKVRKMLAPPATDKGKEKKDD